MKHKKTSEQLEQFVLPITLPITNSQYRGSQTEQNLWIAFIGESMARNKYSYYASIARKCGFEEIAAVFEEVSHNEMEHAKIWFKELGLKGNVIDALYAAVYGEHEEWSNLYPSMADTARAEGFTDLARIFEGISRIEKDHEFRFQEYLYKLDSDTLFHKSGIVLWECRNCGHMEFAMDAPDECPVCSHPQAFFQVREHICESAPKSLIWTD